MTDRKIAYYFSKRNDLELLLELRGGQAEKMVQAIFSSI